MTPLAGLVGGYIVLHLLARGTPPAHIRILDLRPPERNDMKTGLATKVEFVRVDIRSPASVKAAFEKSWPVDAARLPLTVFHTAAVILSSDRSQYLYPFPYSVNVKGTENVLAAAKQAGADVFSATSSASISIRHVNPWVAPWAREPENCLQIQDEKDFDRPIQQPQEFYSMYARSKATAERAVCAANSDQFRTGTIRPANGVYGNPTDNAVGGRFNKEVFPTLVSSNPQCLERDSSLLTLRLGRWLPHIITNLVHGGNVALAHLQHEAMLLSTPSISELPQSGRPFVVTDPNPPQLFEDIYLAIRVLNVLPWRAQYLQPVFMFLLSYLVEWFILLPHWFPWLAGKLPEVTGDLRSLQPAIFSICTHLVAHDGEARKAVKDGGLGYEGAVTTMQGVVAEILEWNRENAGSDANEKDSSGSRLVSEVKRRVYKTSAMLSEELRLAVAKGDGGS